MRIYDNGIYRDATDEEIKQMQEQEAVDVIALKLQKIEQMSVDCKSTIVNGFDIGLSDGIKHHFDLTEEEQLNLITLKEMVTQGMTQIPYHAKDELCVFYSPDDIMTIVNSATNFKTYQISYFNSLKNYINSIDSSDDVNSIEYGVEIPEEYQSGVLKVLRTQLGGDL